MRVLAVVVSYNNFTALQKTVNALLEQVDKVLIVDNGSGKEVQPMLELIAKEDKVVVEMLDRNYGIGYALNKGLKYAKDGGYELLLTMDQDTVLSSYAVAKLKEAIEKDDAMLLATPGGQRSCFARIFSKKFAIAITSGNLVNVALADAIGGYNSDLFIDCVDTDFCLKALKAGYTIGLVEGIPLQHQLGETKQYSLLGKSKQVAVHSAPRLYYMTRNHIIVSKRYWLQFPLYIAWKSVNLVKELTVNIFFTSSKRHSLKMILKGFFHGLKNRLGELQFL
jgi:rhamnosyltransferase